jgi:hypothetical protein
MKTIEWVRPPSDIIFAVVGVLPLVIDANTF